MQVLPLPPDTLSSGFSAEEGSAALHGQVNPQRGRPQRPFEPQAPRRVVGRQSVELPESLFAGAPKDRFGAGRGM